MNANTTPTKSAPAEPPPEGGDDAVIKYALITSLIVLLAAGVVVGGSLLVLFLMNQPRQVDEIKVVLPQERQARAERKLQA